MLKIISGSRIVMKPIVRSLFRVLSHFSHRIPGKQNSLWSPLEDLTAINPKSGISPFRRSLLIQASVRMRQKYTHILRFLWLKDVITNDDSCHAVMTVLVRFMTVL